MSESLERPQGPLCLSCGSVDPEPWTVARDVEYFTSEREYRYYRCRRCDCLYIDPVPRTRLNEIYPANYYAYDAETLGFAGQVKDRLDRRRFRSFARRLPGESLRALDIGGGSGRQLDLLRSADPRFCETWVVEIDRKACDGAEARGHSAWLGRFEDFSAETDFDLILALNIIEHVEDPAAFLRKLRKSLSASGRAVIQTPNWRSWDETLFRRRCWGGYHCPRHWVLWNRASFGALVKRCGLEVHDARYTQGAAFWTTSVLAWLGERGLVQLGPLRPAVQHPLFPMLSAGFAAVDALRGVIWPLSQMTFVVGR